MQKKIDINIVRQPHLPKSNVRVSLILAMQFQASIQPATRLIARRAMGI